MRTMSHRFLRGPNLYSRKPCLLAIVDLEDLDEVSSQQIEGFTDRLLSLVPSLQEHGCCYGKDGGFILRLHEGTYMAHIMEHVLIELQQLSGSKVSFGKARQVPGQPGFYRVICAYEYEDLAFECLKVAMELVQACADATPYDLTAECRRLKQLHDRVAIGPSTRAIIDAARARDIPYRRISQDRSLLVLGQGVNSRRIQATITENTSYIATDIASDKQLTKQLLHEAGLPVPEGKIVTAIADAEEAFSWINGAVTVKPLDANQGRGVTPCVDNVNDVRRAFEMASEHSAAVIVERFIKGSDHRILVVDGVVTAASKRRPPDVTGDGRLTIHQLVIQENENPLRGEGHCSAMTCIPMDEHMDMVLAKKGYSQSAVLPAGEKIALRANANLSTGGIAEDVTEKLHPETVRACIRAAQTIGLDVAGIDLICEDISRPLHAQSAAIVEINAAPGIRMHEHPGFGQRRAAGTAIVDSVFPKSHTRIPIIAITGTNGKTTTTLAAAHIMSRTGKKVGVATTEKVTINGETIQRGDCSGYWSSRLLLESRDVEVAVLEVARGGILKRGLGFDVCDVAVVLNVSADHLGQDGINTLEELAEVKAVVADTGRRAVVLNGDDPHCLAMRAKCRASTEIWLFSLDHRAPKIIEHIASGLPAVVLEENHIVYYQGAQRVSLGSVMQLPMTASGLAHFNIQNAMAALAAILALGHSPIFVFEALSSFKSDASQNPLRMNLFTCDGVLVIVDYAHNVVSYQALLKFARSLSHGHIVGVISAPGDRRDKDLWQIGATCADLLDDIVLYEMDDLRGRKSGEAASAMLNGALTSSARVKCILNVRDAISQSFDSCLPGDLLVLGCASDMTDLGPLLHRLRPLDMDDLSMVARPVSGSVEAFLGTH